MRLVLLTVVVCLLFPVFGKSQIDSFSIKKQQYMYWVPADWIFVRKTNGLRDSESNNLEFNIPLTDKNVFGKFTVSISHITDEERKERDSADAAVEKGATVSNWVSTIDSFQMASGFYEKPTKFKRGKIHQYVRWYYCPLADSIEIAIVFAGQIPHTYESVVDRTIDKFVDTFFIRNSAALMEIKAKEKPGERYVPVLDSITVLQSHLVFPKLDDWTVDTSRVKTDSTTRVLQYSSTSLGYCEQGIITVEVFPGNQYYDPSAAVKKRIQDLTGIEIKDKQLSEPTGPLTREDSIWRAKGDSTFRAKEQHYFFMESESREAWTQCGKNSYTITHTVSVYIQNSRSYYTKMNFTIVYSSTDFSKERTLRNGYDVFLYYMINNTDFEQFYLNNPK